MSISGYKRQEAVKSRQPLCSGLDESRQVRKNFSEFYKAFLFKELIYLIFTLNRYLVAVR